MRAAEDSFPDHPDASERSAREALDISREYFGMDHPRGALVAKVLPDSPATKSHADELDAAETALDVSYLVADALDRAGLHTPFPIQAAVIPDALAGRDVAGRAPTGSGKTLGFGLPLVARLVDARPKRPVALVLAPTRELAEQIMAGLTPFAKAAGHDVSVAFTPGSLETSTVTAG